ncbi:hypothetical protein AAY473_025767, partial [Plecturocebus cupreus]
MISAHCNLCLPCKSDPPTSASREIGFHNIGQAGLELLITANGLTIKLISQVRNLDEINFLPLMKEVETGFHHVTKADLEFLSSNNPLTATSQSAGI